MGPPATSDRGAMRSRPFLGGALIKNSGNPSRRFYCFFCLRHSFVESNLISGGNAQILKRRAYDRDGPSIVLLVDFHGGDTVSIQEDRHFVRCMERSQTNVCAK